MRGLEHGGTVGIRDGTREDGVRNRTPDTGTELLSCERVTKQDRVLRKITLLISVCYP